MLLASTQLVGLTHVSLVHRDQPIMTRIQPHRVRYAWLGLQQEEAKRVRVMPAWRDNTLRQRQLSAQAVCLERLTKTCSRARRARAACRALLLPRATLGPATHVWPVNTRLHQQLCARTARLVPRTMMLRQTLCARAASLASSQKLGTLESA